MTISAKGRYALRMMIDLARNEEEGWISLKQVSERQGISAKYLEQIVTPLVRGGYIKALRGAQGGYRLLKKPEDITALDVLECVSGPLAPVKCLQDPSMVCPRANCCDTVDFWRGLDEVMCKYMAATTLRDFISRKVGHSL